MMRVCHFAAVILPLLAGPALAAESVEPPPPFGTVPTEAHLAWHELEFYGFIHFTLNTFTDREWGNGDESPQLFNPSQMDADQWARVAKESGMQALILTAKHHDGFCLWPSKYTEHSVKHSPWKNGQGDVVKDCADACRKHGLKFGVYLSPWDRNHAEYARPGYVEYYRNQLRELMTNYGDDLRELVRRGQRRRRATMAGPTRNGPSITARTTSGRKPGTLVRELQPGCIRFSDGGPDIRWVGNESGLGYDPNWATFNREGRWPGISVMKSLWHGDQGGTHWVPAECDVSIRPGWFWHESQNDKVKSLDQLLEIYYASVGRGCNLLLNLPPDRRGLFHENDVARLKEFGRVLQDTFRTDLARGKPVTASNVRGGDERFAAAAVDRRRPQHVLGSRRRRPRGVAGSGFGRRRRIRPGADPGVHPAGPTRRGVRDRSPRRRPMAIARQGPNDRPPPHPPHGASQGRPPARQVDEVPGLPDAVDDRGVQLAAVIWRRR